MRLPALAAVLLSVGCHAPGPGMWWNADKGCWCTCDGFGEDYTAAAARADRVAVRMPLGTALTPAGVRPPTR